MIAFAALETFIAWALNILHEERPLPAGLWDWIKKRDDDWRKQPSTSEEFDVLLRAFTGRSLKDESHLWRQFSELRTARHALVGEGVAKIGKRAVEARNAQELVEGAGKIVACVELLLPEVHRRARTEARGPFSRKLASPDEAAALGLIDKNNAELHPLPAGFSIKLHPKKGDEPHSTGGRLASGHRSEGT